jgi:cyd operon protein YbgT
MWYFTWILGLTAALSFGVINAMWYEAEHAFNGANKDEAGSKPTQRF